MKRAQVLVDDRLAGYFIEKERESRYEFQYLEGYDGPPITPMMPTVQQIYKFDHFPMFFVDFLPEGKELETLLKETQIEREDLFEILMCVGTEAAGNITIIKEKLSEGTKIEPTSS